MERVTPQPWLRRVRREPITGILFHGINNGSIPLSAQYHAMKNWQRNAGNVRNPNDMRVFWWGSAADFAVGIEAGEIAQFGNFPEARANWSAGFGEAGTWAMDDYYVSIEIAHTGAADEPYHPGAMANLIRLCAWLAAEFDVPLRRIPFVDQTGAPPRGFASHRATANGVKWGKIDVNDHFDWDTLFAGVRAQHQAEEPHMTRLTWNIQADLPPHKAVSAFEQNGVEHILLDVAPAVIASAVETVMVKELSGNFAGHLRGSLAGGFEVQIDADIFRDPTGIYAFRTSHHRLLGVAAHEGIGHGLNNFGNSLGQQLFDRFRFEDLYELTYDRRTTHSITVEGFCELIRIALQTPAVFKRRAPLAVAPFLTLWAEVAGEARPTTPDWKAPTTYVAYAEFLDDDVGAPIRTPVGLANVMGWEVCWVWEHAGLPRWMAYGPTTLSLPGARDPIDEGAILFRVADVPVQGLGAGTRSMAARAVRRHRAPAPPPAGL